MPVNREEIDRLWRYLRQSRGFFYAFDSAPVSPAKRQWAVSHTAMREVSRFAHDCRELAMLARIAGSGVYLGRLGGGASTATERDLANHDPNTQKDHANNGMERIDLHGGTSRSMVLGSQPPCPLTSSND